MSLHLSTTSLTPSLDLPSLPSPSELERQVSGQVVGLDEDEDDEVDAEGKLPRAETPL